MKEATETEIKADPLREALGTSDEERLDNAHSIARGDRWAELSDDPKVRSLQEANIALSKRVNRLSDQLRSAPLPPAPITTEHFREQALGLLHDFLSARVMTAEKTLDAILALSPPATVDRAAVIEVPKIAINWLFGAAPAADGKWFSHHQLEAEQQAHFLRGRYWWRSKFKSMVPALVDAKEEGTKS